MNQDPGKKEMNHAGIVGFVWLSVKAIGLAFRATWGSAKVAAAILFTLALPALIGCLLVAGGASGPCGTGGSGALIAAFAFGF